MMVPALVIVVVTVMVACAMALHFGRLYFGDLRSCGHPCSGSQSCPAPCFSSPQTANRDADKHVSEAGCYIDVHLCLANFGFFCVSSSLSTISQKNTLAIACPFHLNRFCRA